MNSKSKLNFIVESGVMIALATILSFIKIYEAPFGGSVTAGSMIPIIIISLRWGLGRGLFAGTVYGIVQSIVDPYIVHPLQFLLDYPVAFGLLGLAGMIYHFKGHILRKGSKFEYVFISFSVLLAVLGRLVAHILSGVVFFSEYAGELNPWIYSLLYNGSYLGLEFIISLIVIMLLWKPIKRINIWN